MEIKFDNMSIDDLKEFAAQALLKMQQLEEARVEQWVEIDEFPDYEVSNKGRVRSKDGQLVKAYVNKKGTHIPSVHLINGAFKTSRQVPVLVADAFLGERPEGFKGIGHKDGDVSNNTADNLFYTRNTTGRGRSNIRPVALVKDGAVTEVFQSVGEAATDLGIKGNRVYMYALSDAEVPGGGILRYLDEDGNPLTPEAARVKYPKKGGKPDTPAEDTPTEVAINDLLFHLSLMMKTGHDTITWDEFKDLYDGRY